MRKQRKKNLHYDPEKYRLDEKALRANPAPRIPVILCLDCSFSMRQKKRLDLALKGLEKFLDDIDKNEVGRDALELCIISYGGDEAMPLQNFATVDQIKLPEKLEATGSTPLADAIRTALAALKDRQTRYQENGVTVYRPWLIIIGDDEDIPLNYEKREEIKAICKHLKEETDAKHLTVMSVTVGDVTQKESSLLRSLSPEGKVYALRDLDFRSFFVWLSRSIERTSQSLGGEEIYYEADITWGEAR